MNHLLIVLFQKLSFIGPPLFLFIEEIGFPIPIGDFILSYGGYQISQGIISFPIALILFIIADLSGVSVLYTLSSRYGQKFVKEYGTYIHIDEKKLWLVEKKFRKYGPLFIIFGRHIPGFRIPITVFSGISEITYKTFILSTFISIVLWIPFYLSIGQRLGPKVIQLLNTNGYLFIFLLLLPIVEIALLLAYLSKKYK